MTIYRAKWFIVIHFRIMYLAFLGMCTCMSDFLVVRVRKKVSLASDTMPEQGGHHQQSYVQVRDMDVNLSSHNLDARQVNNDLVHGHKTTVWHHLMVKISRIKLLKSEYGHDRVSRTCPFYKKRVRFLFVMLNPYLGDFGN